MSLDREALKYLVELEETKELEIEGRKYTTKQIVPVKAPMPETLGVNTLTGIVDYVLKNCDQLLFAGEESDAPGCCTESGRAPFFIHIVSHDKVRIMSTLMGEFQQRACVISAGLPPMTQFSFGQYYDHEDFMVALMTQFEPGYMCRQIAAFIGNIKDENVKSVSDDGFTQTVTAKQGISMVQEAAVPNPVELAPYRTFREIEQPVSEFLLRLQPGRGDMPRVALFETDGGQWQLEAIQRIKHYLSDKLSGIVILA